MAQWLYITTCWELLSAVRIKVQAGVLCLAAEIRVEICFASQKIKSY